MATFDTTRTTYGSATAASRFVAALNSVVTTVIAWNSARVTRKALSTLTDRELEDIGLTRGDIDLIAESNRIR